MRITARTVAAATVASIALALSGCSSTNAGGDTTCGDYLNLDSSGRSKVVEKFLSDKGSSTSGINVNLYKASILAYCNTVGTSGDVIKNVDG